MFVVKRLKIDLDILSFFANKNTHNIREFCLNTDSVLAHQDYMVSIMPVPCKKSISCIAAGGCVSSIGSFTLRCRLRQSERIWSEE